MKNLKRIFSIVISLTMVLSLFGAFSAQAADTTGIKKWSSYQNNQDKTVGEDIVYGKAQMDQWRYVANGDTNSRLGLYATDPLNIKNIAVQYNGGKVDNVNKNQIAYYPTTPGSFSGGYSVEMRILLPQTMTNGYQYQICLCDTNGGKDNLTIKWTGKSFTFKLNTVSASENPKAVAGEWLDIKLVVKDGNVTVYESGTEYATAQAVTTSDLSYVSFKDITYGTGNSAYLDDVKITNESTTDLMYYDEFASSYNYEYVQGTGSTTINVYEEVKLVDSTGAPTGYSVPIYATAIADISKLGTFSTTADVVGFDEPINIGWTVYKEQLAWQETFENYTETDIGKAPNLSPWIAGTLGKTIEYENAEAEVKNIVLKYTASGRDNDWLKMGNNKSIDGKFSIEWSFMLPELVANTDCKFQVMADNKALVEPSVSVNSEEKARLGFADRTGNIYPLQYGELKANTWYTVKFNIDTIADTFTYSVGDINDTTVRTIKEESTGAFDEFRFAQRVTTSGDLKIYVDDVKVNKVLTIKSPVAQNITVYKGDDVVLPETATVLLTDGETTDEAEVTWNGTIDTSAVGTKTIKGSVTGVSTPATLNVEVSAFPYEIVSANLTNGSTEVFGLIKGGALSSATLNKIANDTKAGRVYAAVYDADKKLIGANVVSIDTSSTWSKDTHKDIAITLNLPNSNDIDIDTCTLKLFVLSDSLVPFASVKAQSNTDAQAATTVWIAGDSLAQKTSTRPQTGWGEAFETLCENVGINVENRALGGRSSKSFYDQELLKDILAKAKAGDYLFVQFGHNDSKSDDATRYTTYEEGGTFEQYMTKYITEARAKGIIPVILTPVVRATWPKDNGVTNGGTEFNGATYSNLDKYAAAAKRVAAKYHVPMIDIHALTEAYFTALSGDDGEWTDSEKAEVWKYFDYYADTTTLEPGNSDTTHLNGAGAELVANMIKEEMEKIRLPLYKLFK